MTTKTAIETVDFLSRPLEITIAKRKSELIRLQQLITENSKELLEGLYKDLHKPKAEAYITELAIVLNGIDDALMTVDDLGDEDVNLGKWRVLGNLKGSVRHKSLGLVLIIGGFCNFNS